MTFFQCNNVFKNNQFSNFSPSLCLNPAQAFFFFASKMGFRVLPFVYGRDGNAETR